MVCRILDPNENAISGLIPDAVKDMIREATVPWYFTGICNQKGAVLSYGAFSGSLTDEKSLNLEYVYTITDARGKDLGSSLIDASFSLFLKNGFHTIDCHMVGELQKLYEFYPLLLKWKFIPLFEDGHRMYYRYADMKDTETLDIIEKSRAKLPAATSITDKKNYEVRYFIKRMAAKGYRTFSERLFSPYTRYFIKDGEVTAVLPAMMTTENTLHVYEFFCMEKKNKPAIFLSLLADCIEYARKEVGDGLKLIIDIDSESLYQGMRDSFNPPDHEHLIMDLTRVTA